MTTFHIETDPAPVAGQRARGRTLVAGDVIKVGEGAFMDAVILGFNEAGDAKVSRPYAYASNVGTTGPTPLLGAETYVLNAASLNLYPKSGSGRRT